MTILIASFRPALIAGLALWCSAMPAQAQPQTVAPQTESAWPAEKCARYAEIWREATGRLGLKGIGETFRSRHDAFIASGCQSAPDVCPRSTEELELANILVLRGMSAKLASTFFPFRC